MWTLSSGMIDFARGYVILKIKLVNLANAREKGPSYGWAYFISMSGRNVRRSTNWLGESVLDRCFP
jgi:hypothetical protein